jgi:hypothetical protein
MIVALLVLYAVPIISFLFGMVGLWKDPSRWRRYLPMCINFVFVYAYSYTPDIGSNEDLIRYFSQIEFYGTLSLVEALTYTGGALFSQYLYFWLFGSMNMMHLIPAISTSTVYAVAGYITCDTAERYSSKQYIAVVFLFQLITLPFYQLVNNVRNVFAFSLIILAVYLDVIKGKRNIFVWFCYIFGSLLHLTAFTLIIFRVFSALGKKFFGAIVLSQLFFGMFASKIYEWGSVLSFDSAIGVSFTTIIKKLGNYLNDIHSPGASKYLSLPWSDPTILIRLLMVMVAAFGILIIYNVLRTKNNWSSWFRDDKRYYAFVGMIAVTTIMLHFLFYTPNYWRFGSAVYVTIGMLLIPMFCNYRQLTLLPRMLLYGHFLVLPVMFWVQFIFLRRLTNFSDWIMEAFTTNYMTILIDLVNSGI